MVSRVGRAGAIVLMLVSAWLGSAVIVQAADPEPVCVFKNPLVTQGADPSVIFYDDFYYLVQSNNSDFSIGLRKAETLSELANAENVTIWRAPSNTEYSRDLWAPELIALDDGLYIYFAADDGDNNNHRMYALKAATDDPLGAWEFAGTVFKTPELDKWGIDLSVFEYKDQLYGVWSGSDGDEAGATFPQVLYIATMSNPLSVDGERVKILTPTERWETSEAAIAEGPQPFVHDDTVSIVYSANASWTRDYNLGLLVLEGDDPLDPADWNKVGSVFAETVTDEGAVYGLGHNSIPVTSPDGTEWWNIYHGMSNPDSGWEGRDIRMQEMIWNEDGTPNFGTPIPATVAQPVPSGEPCGLQLDLTFNAGMPDLMSDSRITTQGEPGLTLTETEESAQDDETGDLVMVMDGDDLVDLGRPEVSTTGSYTVIVNVLLTEQMGDYTFVTQEGGLNSAFRLHTTEDGHFAFTAYEPLGRAVADAVSSDVVNSNTWYHLAGVRDAITGEIALYVNGELQATAPFKDDFRTVGSVVLGAAKERGKRQHFLVGRLDDVMLYNGALSAEDIAALANE
jgi:GH43 family beta-xylosidase